MLIYQKFKTENVRYEKLEKKIKLHFKAKYNQDKDLKEREKRTTVAIDNFKAQLDLAITHQEEYIDKIKENLDNKLKTMAGQIEEVMQTKSWMVSQIEGRGIFTV